jgi:hypothetical protein
MVGRGVGHFLRLALTFASYLFLLFLFLDPSWLSVYVFIPSTRGRDSESCLCSCSVVGLLWWPCFIVDSTQFNIYRFHCHQ